MAEELVIYRNILGADSNYIINNLGEVYSLNYKRTGLKKKLKERDNGNGYKTVFIKDNNGIMKSMYIHKLMILSFYNEIPKGFEVEHKNGIRSDNRLSNLMLVTHYENINLRHKINNNRRHVKVYCPELNKYFKTITECGRYFEVSPEYIRTVLLRGNKYKRKYTLYKVES